MTRTDDVNWVIVGGILFIVGLILAFSSFSLVRFLGVLCLIFGIAALLLGAVGLPRPSSRPRPS